jgi:hypothetical protein
LHEARPSQGAELLGQVRSFDTDLGGQLANAVFAVAEDFEDPDACGMSERLEQLGLCFVGVAGHVSTWP